jgi:malonyl CoA-acyl carrier protein transacylase
MVTDEHPQFGTVIERTTYRHGEQASHTRTIEESIVVTGTLDVLTKIGDALKRISISENHKLTIEVEADHKTLEPVRIKLNYPVERITNANPR